MSSRSVAGEHFLQDFFAPRVDQRKEGWGGFNFRRGILDPYYPTDQPGNFQGNLSFLMSCDHTTLSVFPPRIGFQVGFVVFGRESFPCLTVNRSDIHTQSTYPLHLPSRHHSWVTCTIAHTDHPNIPATLGVVCTSTSKTWTQPSKTKVQNFVLLRAHEHADTKMLQCELRPLSFSFRCKSSGITFSRFYAIK